MYIAYKTLASLLYLAVKITRLEIYFFHYIKLLILLHKMYDPVAHEFSKVNE